MSSERLNAIKEWKAANLNLIAQVLGICTAVLTFTTAGLGVLSVQFKGTNEAKDSSIESLQKQLDQTKEIVTNQQADIESLHAENQNLEAVTPSALKPSGSRKIRAAGQITLAEHGDSIDLNSTLSNFGAGLKGYYTDSLRFYNGTISTYFLNTVNLETGTASYEACSAATGYHDVNSVEPHDLLDGTVCFRLSSKRFAKIVVESYDQNSANLAITVWD